MMAATTTGPSPATPTEDGRFVRANGIDVFYVEAGTGEPLVLLNNGMISSNRIWAGWPSSYAAHRPALAQEFRVIEPDLRGSGRSTHTGGPITYDLLADDLTAFCDAVGLDQPAVCGYGDGGEVAIISAIRHPGAIGPIVNHGGFDLLNPDPDSPTLVIIRQMLGGRPDARAADPAAFAHESLHTMVGLMKADHDATQGAGAWRTVLARTFERVSQPSGYSVADLAGITTPTLILVGDRDPFCPVEEAVAAYRALPRGALAVVADTANGITAHAVRIAAEFLRRLTSRPSPTSRPGADR
jgi:pimeloyl-ACP methyl ester carboxylesterase